MRKTVSTFAHLALAACFLILTAGAAAAERLTPERVFADPSLTGPRAALAKLSPDAKWVTYLQPKANNAQVQDLWAQPVAGGAPFLLIDADQLSSSTKTLSEAEKSRRERMRVSVRGVVDYAWDDRGENILVPLDGDVYLYDVKSRQTRRLTSTPADEVDARLSPKGTFASYVREQNLYVLDLKTGQEKALTTGGKGTLSYGLAEFIAEEEMGRFQGYWWSPDETQIAYTRVDESGVDIIPRFEISADGAKLVEQRYPKAGRPNAVVEVYVKSLQDGREIKLDLGANPDIYVARVKWSRDGKTVYVERQSRDQHRLDLIAFDPKTGQGRVLLTETAAAWTKLNDDFTPLKDGSFLWGSERSGYHHLYRYGADGVLISAVTSGDWPVAALEGIDETAGRAFFLASKDTPIEQELYSVSYLTPEQPRRLTPAGGWWSADLARNGKAFLGTYSDPETPQQTGLYDASGKRLAWIVENKLDAHHPYAPYKNEYSAPEFGTLTAADGEALYWRMLKPRGFDPKKRYPVVVSIYGGPASQTARKTFIAPTDRLLQDAGYIVFTLDNRGTPNRSVKFQTAIYRRFGTVDIDDQVMGGKWLQTLPFVDPAHIGMMGWSQGGFVTLMTLTYPDTPFVAGAAGAPPTQWGLYDTHYTEEYMDTPQANPEGYAGGDVLPRLGRLKPGSLLLMQGMADDNVILNNSIRVMDDLQKRAIPFELMLYPGERHGIRTRSKQLQQWKLYLDFFARKLKPEG